MKRRCAPNSGTKNNENGKLKEQQLDAFTDLHVPLLTTDQGLPIPDNHNSLKAGARGPTLRTDFILCEKITHFDHEGVPERVAQALMAFLSLTNQWCNTQVQDFCRTQPLKRLYLCAFQP